MNLLDLLDDPRPFALLRRRTPGRDHDVVELLLGPVREVEHLADIPDEGLALIPFRQIRERGFDVRDDGTPLAVLTPRSVTNCRSRRRWRSCRRTTCGSRTAASTSTTRSTPGSWNACSGRRSGAARVRTS